MHIEGCKHELEITVPQAEIAKETDRVIADLQKKVRLPGFRPGKTPASIVKSRFASEVRQDVMENLVPKFFNRKVAEEQLDVVGTPSVKDVRFEDGEPLVFTAQFEVAPVFEPANYRGVLVHYHEPEATPEEIESRLNQLREQKAQFVNIDPQQAVDGDYCLVDLESVAGADKPVAQQDMVMLVGDEGKMPEFSDALRGMTPDESKEFDIAYPEAYEAENLRGRTVRFKILLKMLRMKELPELNDDFAQDLGDFDTLGALRDAVGKTIGREKDMEAQRKAKNELVASLVAAHDFAVPDTFVEHQLDTIAESQFRQATGKNIDIRLIKERIDWEAFTKELRRRR